jgi:hypothetical protein
MFSIILPLRIDPERVMEQKLEAAFRGTLAGRRIWAEAQPARPTAPM